MGQARASSIVGVIGCTGGVGASSVACALAVAARAGVLVDLDTFGGGLDMMLGIAGASGARWSALQVAGGAIDPVDLSRGLPRWRGVPVLAADGAAPRLESTMAVLDAAQMLGPVVVDCGRGLCANTARVLKRCDLVLAVVEAEPRGVAAVRAAANRLEDATMGLVVRRGSLPRAEMQALTGVPVLGMLAPLGRRPSVRVPRSLLRVAAGVMAGVSISPEHQSASAQASAR